MSAMKLWYVVYMSFFHAYINQSLFCSNLHKNNDNSSTKYTVSNGTNSNSCPK